MKPAAVKFGKDEKPILPGKEAEVIDLLYEATQARYEIQRQVKRLEAIESACEDRLRDTIDLKERQGGSGRMARIEIEPVRVPVTEDFDKFFAYLLKTKDASLIEKRPSRAAIQERWEHGKSVPGIGGITVKKVHVHKLKERK